MQEKYIALQKQIEAWMNAHKDEFVTELQGFARIPSVSRADLAAPGAPFGPDCRKVLDYALTRAEHYDFKGCDLDGCGCADEHNADLGAKTMFVMAVATSIDALAVGISLAMAGGVNIWLSIALIGLTTFSFSAAGVKIGSLFGAAFEKKAQLAGGAILIGLGVKILLEHLGVLV